MWTEFTSPEPVKVWKNLISQNQTNERKSMNPKEEFELLYFDRPTFIINEAILSMFCVTTVSSKFYVLVNLGMHPSLIW